MHSIYRFATSLSSREPVFLEEFKAEKRPFTNRIELVGRLESIEALGL
jgi:hypothetical protein